MKKLLTYLSVAMLGMAAVACQEEIGVATPGDGNVTITLQTPDVATKAIADGENVDIVYYEIYKAETGHKNSLTGTPLIKDSVPMDGKEATLSLNLLQGQQYVGLFWAQVDGNSYYVVEDLRNVQVNYPNEEGNKTAANDEARAAFCQAQQFATGENVTVTLERPFAQINLGTSFHSLDIDYEIALKESSMTVYAVANSFNVAAMTAGTTTVDVVFDLATVPYAFDPSETLEANGDTWAYAGMNYVLVPGDAANVNLSYAIKTDVGTVSRDVPSVPVKKNYRTNLLGNLLTQETVIEIVVDENFNTPDLEPDPIYMAAALGGEFTLTDDVVLPEPLVIQSSLVLNLNGYSITGGKEYVSGMTGVDISAISVENGATLTIKGNGSVTGTGFYAIYAKNGTLNIEGGNVVAETSAVQIANATVNIEGGMFSNTSDDKRYTINCLDANWKDGSAKVNITGGTFVNFNPANNAAEGEGTNFMNDNCSVIVNGDYYTVVLTNVSTAAQLQNALALAPEIKLAADIDLSNVEWGPVGTAEAPFSGTFDGQGHKIIGLSLVDEYAGFIAYAGENAVVKDVDFEDVNIASSKYGAAVICVAGNNVTVENVTVSGNVEAASYAAGLVLMNNDDADKVVIKNCVNNANVTSKRAGGIAAWVTGGTVIENVINNGDVTGSINACGITNRIAGTVKNAKNYGKISGSGNEPSSGIAGILRGASSFEYCYNYGDVVTTTDDPNASAAGILGQTPSAAATLKYCANYGDVTAELSYAAGIAYSLYGTISASYCYNAGAVYGADAAGAIAPKAQYGANDTAKYCLNAGDVTSAGKVYQASNKNTSCYYYSNETLKDVANDAVVYEADALAVLNGGDDDTFFALENGKIAVK